MFMQQTWRSMPICDWLNATCWKLCENKRKRSISKRKYYTFFPCRYDQVHTSPKKFENVGFTLKTHQIFPVHNTPEEFKTQQSQVLLLLVLLVLQGNLAREITLFSWILRCRKVSFSKCFSIETKTKRRCIQSPLLSKISVLVTD